MEAGRELDKLIAEKVMGWHRGTSKNGPEFPGHWYDAQGVYKAVVEAAYYPECTFRPSTNIADAWQVVEKMKDNYAFHLILEKAGYYLPIFTAGEAALKLCNAALKAVEIEQEMKA